MKLKVIFIAGLIACSLSIFAEEMILHTDDGSITVDIAEAKDGKIQSDQIITLLKARIDKLEYDYVSRLGSYERAEALKEIKKIRILISVLPRDTVVVIDGTKKNTDDSVNKEMSDADFKVLTDNIKMKKFKNEKVAVIKLATENNYFSFIQLQMLLKEVEGVNSSDLISVIKAVYPKLSDKKNRYMLFDYFKFQSDKDSVKKIMDDIDRRKE